MSPGLSCLLAAHAARGIDVVEEIHVAKAGTGGPACARATHASLRGPAASWRDGRWQSEPPGSGRELCWFPEPVGGVDCYVASSAEPSLLTAAFPTARRVTARVAATRRDQRDDVVADAASAAPRRTASAACESKCAGSPMGERVTQVVGAVDRPAIVAGTLAAIAAVAAVRREIAPGAGGLAVLAAAPGELLARLAERGVKVAAFEGGA